MAIPSVTLINGKSMPILGLGTWNTWESPKGEVAQAVKDAIDVGYRHIDTAHVYNIEAEVGEGIKAKIDEGVVKREDLFVVSKLWNTHHDPKEVRGALEHTLKQLQLEYLDLYLIHWPIGYQKSDDPFPKNSNGIPLHSDFDLLDTWREMEKLVEAGLTKSIGISNFNIEQVDYIYDNAKIKPATNQIECHPYLLNTRLRDHCNARKMVVTGYSPLGSPARPWAKPDERVLLKEPKVIEIAEKYKKTPGQILIRFQIDLGNVVIPKSVSKERIKQNLDVFDFKLTDEEVKDLSSFGYTQRLFTLSDDVNHPEYPFEDYTSLLEK